jgi:hypothetical protein
MKKSTIWKSLATIAIMLVAGNTLFAQEVAMPAGLQQHGNNSSGTAVASEAIDSVAVGSVMQYWAQPDAASSSDNTFTWTVAPALGSQTAGGTTNLATITFGAAAATGTIQVAEGTASCPDLTPVSIDIQVIPVPTATFGADPAAVCTNDPIQTFTLPVTLATAVASGTMRINYTVYNPDNSVLIAAQDLNIKESTGSFNITLSGATQYGTYYVIINSVSDHVSRKPAVDVPGAIADNRIDLVVNRTPVTGPIYHLPNL